MAYDEGWYDYDGVYVPSLEETSDNRIQEILDTKAAAEEYRLNNPPPSWNDREPLYIENEEVKRLREFNENQDALRQETDSLPPIEMYGLGNRVLSQKPGDDPRDWAGDEVMPESMATLKRDIDTYDEAMASGATPRQLDVIAGLRPPPTEEQLSQFEKDEARWEAMLPEVEIKATEYAKKTVADWEKNFPLTDRSLWGAAKNAWFNSQKASLEMQAKQRAVDYERRKFDKLLYHEQVMQERREAARAKAIEDEEKYKEKMQERHDKAALELARAQRDIDRWTDDKLKGAIDASGEAVPFDPNTLAYINAQRAAVKLPPIGEKWAEGSGIWPFNKEKEFSGYTIGGGQQQPTSGGKTIVRTGTDKQGRKVVKYSDGSIGYAQ